MSELRISVRTTGGVLGLDRLVEVSEGRLTVSEEGSERTTTLTPEQTSRLDDAAGQLVTLSTSGLSGTLLDVSDAGGSQIAITDGERETSFQVMAGTDAPNEVWDLLELLEGLCEPG